jgi:UDP-GlcNAc:undecaprenyl-phosphate GlcNAc-1-phosphate transferase
MNSINMIDNMDAIASSISISILIAAIMVMHYSGNNTSISPYFIACMIGALIGFVKWNWYPSKIMMGDTGSQFLGVLLATVSISLFWKFRILDGRSLQVKQWLFPYLVFLTPFIDTVTVVFRRTIRGQGFWVGGRDHITHILVYFGLSQRAVAWVVIGSSLVNILLGWYMLHLMENWKYWYSILFALYMFIVFIFMQIIYVRASYKMNAK